MFTSFSEVVVGFDGSANARRALHWGMQEAHLWHAKLRVLVAEGDYGSSHGDGRAKRVYRDWAEDWSAQAEAILAQTAYMDWTVTKSVGIARDVLTEASRPETVTVVGSVGHGLVGGSLLGSVSQHLARHAGGPVVVVRGHGNSEAGHVVVGVDGSPPSERALDFGLAHAAAAGLGLTAVYGWSASHRSGTPLAGQMPPEFTHEMIDVERWLAEAVTGRSELYPNVKIERLAIPRSPANALIDASASAGLLVVGSRGHNTAEDMVLGSVSQNVLRRGHCPVAIVR
jgi:nucleotide-binding universal stress UspA family protein